MSFFRHFSPKMLMDIAYSVFAACAMCTQVIAQTPALDQARTLIAQRQFIQAAQLLRAQTEGPIRDTLLAQALIAERGASDNVAQALALLQRAAASGYPDAVYPLATIYASSGQAAEAQQLLSPLAARNDPRAHYVLGRIAESARDYVRAARHYEVAAFAGNGDAMNNLGFMHANGQGVVRDDGRAASYYREGVAVGSIEAGINLVLLADAGRTALASSESRTQLLERGAQAGQSTALRLLGRAAPAQALPPALATQALAQPSAQPPATTAQPQPPVMAATASTTTPRSAEPVDAAALYAQAIKLQRGDGVMRDLAKAAALLERAALAGLRDAQIALATVYEYGLGVVSDSGKTKYWRDQSAKR